MKRLNVVDSSGWLEYFINSDQAELFASVLADTERLLVPAISIYEVFKKVLREHGEADALEVASIMLSGEVVEIDADLAMEAARYPLPLADSMIYAVAQQYDALLWTQDEHFKDLPNVRYLAKK